MRFSSCFYLFFGETFFSIFINDDEENHREEIRRAGRSDEVDQGNPQNRCFGIFENVRDHRVRCGVQIDEGAAVVARDNLGREIDETRHADDQQQVTEEINVVLEPLRIPDVNELRRVRLERTDEKVKAM